MASEEAICIGSFEPKFLALLPIVPTIGKTDTGRNIVRD
jgi:hypothetical protein